MQADWDVEIGGDAPVIESRWPGFVDLRRDPEHARQLPEAKGLPGLAEALARLNAAASTVWTSKCDVWRVVDFTEFDPDELDAPPGCATHAMACYIDLLPRCIGQWATPDLAIAACKDACGVLSAIPLRCCRLDLVIRRALLEADRIDLGITAYLTACGSSEGESMHALRDALAALSGAVCPRAGNQ
jgi:hypothetical protein